MPKILLVEDEPATALGLTTALGSKGYLVDHASDADQAMSFIETYSYDLIILDWHLNKETSGIDFLRKYRVMGGAALVLMTTSRAHIDDKELGFVSGADDYLTKPFFSKELLFRVEALLRRVASTKAVDSLQMGRLRLDRSKRLAFADNEELSLRPKEYALLEYLLRHPDYVLSAEDLKNALWSSDDNPSDHAVRMVINRLRQAILGAIGEDPVETVHGMGYKLRIIDRFGA